MVSAELSTAYDAFLADVRKGGRVLDAGCGSGRDLKEFCARGFDAVGIDASTALVKLAHEYSGVPCYALRLEDIEYELTFDGIWACASLLHLPKHALVSVLRRLRKALIPGGVMFASVQSGEGEAVAADGRFFAYYEREEFRRYVESAGFSVSRLWVSEDSLHRRSVVRWINLLARS